MFKRRHIEAHQNDPHAVDQVIKVQPYRSGEIGVFHNVLLSEEAKLVWRCKCLTQTLKVVSVELNSSRLIDFPVEEIVVVINRLK